jgi:hypothetical protein
MTKTLSRLEAQEPELFQAIAASTDELRFKAALFACNAAVTEYAPDDAEARSVLSALETGSQLSGSEAQALSAYAEGLDESYWAKRNGFEQRQEGSQEEWQAAFDRFLAVKSVALLATDRSEKGIGEAIYEALGTASDVPAARQRIMSALKG